MTTRIKPRWPGPLAPKTVAVPSVTPTPASQAADAVAGKAGWKPKGRVPVKAPRAPALSAAGEKLLEKGQQALQRGRKVAQKVQDGSLQRAIGGPLARLSKAERRFLAANLPLALPFRENQIVKKGDVVGVKEALVRSAEKGMQSFDVALHKLYLEGKVTLEEFKTAATTAKG
jgi:hypothetical protein